jgi:hypothetical protein
MFAKGVLDWSIHEVGIPGLCQEVGKTVARLSGCGGFRAQARADATGIGQQILVMKAFGSTQLLAFRARAADIFCGYVSS